MFAVGSRRQQRCATPLQREFLGIIGTGDGGAVASRGALALEGDYLWDLKAAMGWWRVSCQSK